MLRVLLGVSTKITPSLYFKSPSIKNGTSNFIFKSLISPHNANFTSLATAASPASPASPAITTSQWISQKLLLKPQRVSSEQIRTVTKYSLKLGKRKTVKAVIHRFFRLRWGIWIRTKAGRNKKLWKKSASQRNRLLNHVFCNKTQSKMLDKMVTKFWRKPKYYIEDPYESYHQRENFYFTKKKPWRPEGVDYE